MQDEKNVYHLLAEWVLSSAPNNERQAMEQVAALVQPLLLSPQQRANLKTAVAEAVLNAMEHGNHYQPDKVVTLQILASATAVLVRVSDQGTGELHPINVPAIPDLEAKLAGREAPRGWGLFLIKNLVDELRVTNDEHSHSIELTMYRQGRSVSNQKD